jgi:hypothetical protein
MGSFNTVMAMESKRGKYTGHILLPKNTFQIFYVRVQKRGKSSLEKNHLKSDVLWCHTNLKNYRVYSCFAQNAEDGNS